MMQVVKSVTVLFCLLLVSARIFAASGDLTEATEHINALFVIMAQLLVFSLFVLGVIFILLSIAKYKKRKKMPTFIPFQTIVIMLLGGIFLLMVGVLYFYVGDKAFGPNYLSLFAPADDRL